MHIHTIYYYDYAVQGVYNWIIVGDDRLEKSKLGTEAA